MTTVYITDPKGFSVQDRGDSGYPVIIVNAGPDEQHRILLKGYPQLRELGESIKALLDAYEHSELKDMEEALK